KPRGIFMECCCRGRRTQACRKTAPPSILSRRWRDIGACRNALLGTMRLPAPHALALRLRHRVTRSNLNQVVTHRGLVMASRAINLYSVALLLSTVTTVYGRCPEVLPATRANERLGVIGCVKECNGDTTCFRPSTTEGTEGPSGPPGPLPELPAVQA